MNLCYLRVTCILFTLTPPLVHAADPVVANVVSAQRAGTKLVDITFDVSDADSDQLVISVEISDNSGTTFAVPATAVTGYASVSAPPPYPPTTPWYGTWRWTSISSSTAP